MFLSKRFVTSFLVFLGELLLLCTVGYLSANNSGDSRKNIPLTVKMILNDGTIILSPYVSPYLEMRLDKNSRKLSVNEILHCQEITEDQSYHEHKDKFVILQCGDVKLKLSGVFFYP